MNAGFDLQERTALVTGAGRGIGASIAKDLAELGCGVVLAGRNAERLQAVRSEIQSAGGRVAAYPGDICEPGWLNRLMQQNEPIDIFIHCAAAFATYGPLQERTETEIKTVIETSLTAAVRISAALLPGMVNKGYGRLLFVGSRAASLGAAHQVVYATAKGGLEALVRSLTAENAGNGVAAHLLEPGLIDTERTRDAMTDAARASMVAATPAGRIGAPADVAAAVRYLLSPGADFLRGVTLRIDGGVGLGLPPVAKPR